VTAASFLGGDTGGRTSVAVVCGATAGVVLVCQVRATRCMRLLDRVPNLRRSKLGRHRLNLIYVGRVCAVD
jgi:hypothetical protein